MGELFMIKIDCQKYADEIIEQVKQIPNKRKDLMIFTAGDDPASASYMKGKHKDCVRSGVGCSVIRVADQRDLLMKIALANMMPEVGGIIVQLPLPEGFNEQEAVNAVQINKDVDGFKINSPFLPCTPEGILYILDKEIGDLTGKSVLLIGKGKLVGRPLIDLLLERGCTLTIAHSKTENLNRLLLMNFHDIVITAVGKPKLVDLRYTNADVVIDAGISRDENGKLCGDCFNFDPYDMEWMKVTTVPNGIGLMTRAMLMKHMGEVNGR
jgi:methylenetetrahydrofolate dehydrogenase (NADP+)/methenyltetrahydrofolate cyclohydrolase